MPSRSPLQDPEHWRRRAAEARGVADQLRDDPAARAAMLDIAESYERLARLAQAKRTSQPR